MKQPAEYDNESERVCRLLKSIYGLRQAGWEWNRKFDLAMSELKFTWIHVDGCVYIRWHDAHYCNFITVWVDDLTLFTQDDKGMKQLKRDLQSKFDLKDMETPSLLLGIQICQNPETDALTLSQSNYIVTVFECFGMDDCKPATTPMDMNVTMARKTDAKVPFNKSLYNQAIRSLLYLLIVTRLDITYPVNLLSQFASDPSDDH